jgi:hypothetical protein
MSRRCFADGLTAAAALLILAIIQRRAKPEKLVGGFKGV